MPLQWKTRRVLIAVVGAAVLASIVVLGTGEVLSRPAVHLVGEPPEELRAASVRIPIGSTAFVAGWFARGTGHGSVLLLHGVHADRTRMLGRALFLHDAGYSVLLIDMPAHGESSGERMTFGAREGSGVVAALGYLRETLPDEPVGVIGVSLGAASLVLSHPPRVPDAMVLESMYPTITDAVVDRLVMRLGPIGEFVAPLLLWQFPLRTGIAVDALRPVVAITAWHVPVLIASGTDDRQTTWSETERIFAASNAPKALWAVQGAAHVDLHAHAPADYERRILKFFAHYLRNEA